MDVISLARLQNFFHKYILFVNLVNIPAFTRGWINYQWCLRSRIKRTPVYRASTEDQIFLRIQVGNTELDKSVSTSKQKGNSNPRPWCSEDSQCASYIMITHYSFLKVLLKFPWSKQMLEGSLLPVFYFIIQVVYICLINRGLLSRNMG